MHPEGFFGMTFTPSPSAGPWVCAVVVTYFPDAGFAARLERIAAQVSRVIVVDNGTTGEALGHLDRALEAAGGVAVIRNPENLGVAAALNQGIRRALGDDSRCAWIATFDQDSMPAHDMVEKMLAAWNAWPDPDRLMVAGPRTAFVASTPLPEPADSPPWREVTHVITSGSLICCRAFDRAGYFNEGLFIDYVDIEYCLRLRTLGYQVIEVQTTQILHHMGHLEEQSLLGRRVHPTHHTPLRRYYQFRNALLLDRQYRQFQSGWCRRNRIILMKILILILLYERHRWQSLIQILKGIGHGLPDDPVGTARDGTPRSLMAS
jgi:rhamnosyltransferase